MDHDEGPGEAPGGAPWRHAPAWSAADECSVLAPYVYLASRPGKEFRTRLLDAFHVWMPSVPSEALEHAKQMVRRLHTASLMMDDVEDASELRRGAPAAHIVYGVAQTINTANYVYFQVLSEVSRVAPYALPALITELEWLHRGQGLELYWRENAACPTEAEYMHMVMHKTGGLFRVALRMMAATSAGTADVVAQLVPFANVLGLLFQIRDDYLNLQPGQVLAKELYDDITEGKYSFPILHAVRTGDQTLPNILQQHTHDPAVKMRAVTYMDTVTHSFAYTRDAWHTLYTQALADLGALECTLGANPLMRAIVDGLGTSMQT